MYVRIPLTTLRARCLKVRPCHGTVDRDTAPDYARLGSIKRILNNMADAVETGRFKYGSTIPRGPGEGERVDEVGQGLPSSDVIPYVTRLRGISDAFSLSEDILLNNTGYLARLLDALNVSAVLRAEMNQYDVRLDAIVDHFKAATRDTVGCSGTKLHVLSDQHECT